RREFAEGEMGETSAVMSGGRGLQRPSEVSAAGPLTRVFGADDGDARSVAARCEPAREGEGRLVDGHFEPRAGARADDGVTAAKLAHGLAELLRRADAQKVMRVLEEALHLFGGEPAAQRVYEVVVLDVA